MTRVNEQFKTAPREPLARTRAQWLITVDHWERMTGERLIPRTRHIRGAPNMHDPHLMIAMFSFVLCRDDFNQSELKPTLPRLFDSHDHFNLIHFDSCSNGSLDSEHG